MFSYYANYINDDVISGFSMATKHTMKNIFANNRAVQLKLGTLLYCCYGNTLRSNLFPLLIKYITYMEKCIVLFY